MDGKPNDLDLSTIEIWKRWIEGAEDKQDGSIQPFSAIQNPATI